MHKLPKLRSWIVHVNDAVAGRREKKYLPVTLSDYPIKNERYVAFETRAGSVFPGFVEPNQLTFLRIILCIVLFSFARQLSYTAIFVMTIIAGLTDFFDGALARAKGKKTRLGIVLDPLADKLLILSVLFVLLFRGDVRPAYILYMFLCETHVFIIPLLSYAHQWYRGPQDAARTNMRNRIRPVLFGRVKLHFYVYAVLLILIGRILNVHVFLDLGDCFFLMGVSAAVIAFFQYVLRWTKNPY